MKLRSTTEVNQKVIVALSSLTEERLRDCATELQVGLEMFGFDYAKELKPMSPEEFFEAFAAHEKYGLDYSSIDGSSLADLSSASVYLVAAWNFNNIAEYFLSSRWRKDGWSEEEASTRTLTYMKAVDYLIGRVLAVRTGRTDGLNATSWARHNQRRERRRPRQEDRRCRGASTLRAAGWRVLVHGWGKRKGRWTARELDVS